MIADAEVNVVQRNTFSMLIANGNSLLAFSWSDSRENT